MAKLNVEFGPEADALLTLLADRKGTSKVEVIRRALNVYSFLEEKRMAHASILIKDSDGERELLVT